MWIVKTLPLFLLIFHAVVCRRVGSVLVMSESGDALWAVRDVRCMCLTAVGAFQDGVLALFPFLASRAF